MQGVDVGCGALTEKLLHLCLKLLQPMGFMIGLHPAGSFHCSSLTRVGVKLNGNSDDRLSGVLLAPGLGRPDKSEGEVTISTIMVGAFISLVGIGLLMYGRKESRVPHLAVGLVLVIYPYFIGNALVQIGVAVIVLLGLAMISRLGY